MTARGLRLEVVTPDGVALEEEGVEFVLVHRREPRFEVGSEVVIYPLHAPMLVRLAAAPICYRKGAETITLDVDAGFAEVLGDKVVVVTNAASAGVPVG